MRNGEAILVAAPDSARELGGLLKLLGTFEPALAAAAAAAEDEGLHPVGLLAMPPPAPPNANGDWMR